jgi:DNA mismatch repair protein MutS2
LQPLFQLQTGNPGSSFAIEIARKIGLPEDLIADAAEKVGSDHLDYDKHLQDIVRDKRYWENKRRQIRLKEKKLEAVLEKYEAEMEEINKQRKEIVRKAKDEALTLITEANAKIENTIRQIREEQADKEKTKVIRKDLQDFREQVLNKLKDDKKTQSKYNSRNEGNQQDNEGVSTFKAGSQVRIKGQSATGKIIEIQGKTAIIAFGLLKSSVKITDLEIISNNQLKKEMKKNPFAVDTVTDDVRQRKLHFKSEIDLRGFRADEALQAVTYFIDDAIMVGVGSVRILHGTGTGALRQLIRQYLGTVHGVKKFRDEHVQFGGAGITVVEFEN